MKKQSTMQNNIRLSIFRQGKRYVAYSSTFDISTSEKTLREVRRRFTELVAIFQEELALINGSNNV